MQKLPYVVVTNPHISQVYDLYYHAFDTFSRVREVETLEDNDRLCETISSMLRAHLTVIPKLAMGVMECSGLMDSKELDTFMNTLLRAVSRYTSQGARDTKAHTQLFSLAHLPPSHCRTTYRLDQGIQSTITHTRHETLPNRIHRRSVPEMRRQRRYRAVR